MEPTELSACGAEVAGQEAGLEQQRHRVAVGGGWNGSGGINRLHVGCQMKELLKRPCREIRVRGC